MIRGARSARRALLLVTAVASVQLIATSPAFALEEAGGECSDGDSNAFFSTFYTQNGSNNTVNYYEFIIGNPNGLGNKSNVNIQHKRNVALGPDEILQNYDSGDNVAPNVINRIPAQSGLTTPAGQAHTRFEFTFDNAFFDDNCNADTVDF